MKNTFRVLVGFSLILIVLIGYTWAAWQFFTERVPGGNDFLPRYLAWKYFLQTGDSPYSDSTAYHVNEAVYGRQPFEGEDENREIYPFYYGLLYIPFTFIDYPLARAIFMTILQVSLFIGVGLVMRMFSWKPSLWLLAMTYIWVLFDYHQARGVLLGQFAILGFFSLSSSLYLLGKKKDLVAGIILVLATIKPPLVFLVIPFLLLWALIVKRWKFIVGFVASLSLLVLVSFLIYPDWFDEWLHNIFYYPQYTVGQSPVWMLTHIAFPQLGSVGDMVISILFLVITFYLWYLVIIRQRIDEFLWVLSITLLVQNLIVPRSATTNYVMLLIPVLWLFATLDQRSSSGKWLIVTYQLLTVVGMWRLHFFTVEGNQEQPIMFIPELVIVALFLIFGRTWLCQTEANMRVSHLFGMVNQIGRSS